MRKALSQEAARVLTLRRLQQRVAEVALGQAQAQLAQADAARAAVETVLDHHQQAWMASFSAHGIDLHRARSWGRLVAEQAAELEGAMRVVEGAQRVREGALTDLSAAILRVETAESILEKARRRVGASAERRSLDRADDRNAARWRQT